MIDVKNIKHRSIERCVIEAAMCIKGIQSYELLRAIVVLAKDAYYTRYMTDSIFNAFNTMSRAAFYNGMIYLLDKYKENEMTEDTARYAKLTIERYRTGNVNDGTLFKDTVIFIAKERYNYKSPFYLGLPQFMQFNGKINELYWITVAFDKLIHLYYSLMSLPQGSLLIWIELLQIGQENWEERYAMAFPSDYTNYDNIIQKITDRIIGMYEQSDIGFIKKRLVTHYIQKYGFDIGHYTTIRDDIKTSSLWVIFKSCGYIKKQLYQ